MAGIYGSHPEDRYYENMLDKYLDDTYGEDTQEEEEEDESDIQPQTDDSEEES